MLLRSSRLLVAIGSLIILLLPRTSYLLPARADEGKLVLSFYYAWYDQKTWNSGVIPDVPLKPYVSASRETMVRHVEQAKGAGIDAFVLNWWGKGNQTEKNLKTLLGVADEKGFRVAVDFDINSPFMGGLDSYADNLRHLHAVHATHPAYLDYRGRPVVFFYNVSRLPVAAWRTLRDQADPNREALWIAEGTDVKYLSVFDGHHLYSITWSNRIPPSQTLPNWGNRVRKYNRENGTSKLWVATVMPGYDDRKVRPGSGFARSRDGGDYYRQCWQAAIASKSQWVIVNSFNEWPEGSYIEPSQAYGNLYLDLTREWATRFKGMVSADAAPAPAPTATLLPPTPMPTPPPAPTPTPRPNVHFPKMEWSQVRMGLRRGCGYVLTDVGMERFWLLYCPADSATGEFPLLVY